MDRLRSLEIFREVADKGSFVRAAETLDLSTAVVTRAVQELEKLLGARLLQRSTRRLALTGEGEHVLERARTMLGAFDELTATSRLSTHEVAGTVRFTAPASFGTARLGPVLADFMARHPRVQVELLLTDAPLDPVEHGLDLMLRVAAELPDSLIARRIGESRTGVFASPAYLRRKGTPRHPDDLAAHDCLVHVGGTGRRMSWQFRDPVTQAQVAPAVGARLCANNGEALLAAAVHGSGLALLPHAIAEPALARGELQQVLADWASPPRGVFLAYTSRRHQPLRVRKLLEHLAQALTLPDAGAAAAAPPRIAQAFPPLPLAA